MTVQPPSPKKYFALTFHCYTPLHDIEQLREEQHFQCLSRNLRGRLKIAPEGVNGKLSGRKEDCIAYLDRLKQDPRFADIQVVSATYTDYVSEKLHVRLKKEIVNTGAPHIKPYEKQGIRITPKTFEKMIQEEDVLIVDVRSDYEHRLGKFKKSITFDISAFREFPEQIQALKKYKDKRIIAVCTSSIKSAKASACLLQEGFEQVYQLQGGIIAYGQETDGSAFEGSCYVFDNRIKQAVNTQNPTIISHCYACKKPCDRMVNCANPQCNLHAPLCECCAERLEGACSTACQKAPGKRPYNGTGYYVKKSNHYNPYKQAKRDTRSFFEKEPA